MLLLELKIKIRPCVATLVSEARWEFIASATAQLRKLLTCFSSLDHITLWMCD